MHSRVVLFPGEPQLTEHVYVPRLKLSSPKAGLLTLTWIPSQQPKGGVSIQ